MILGVCRGMQVLGITKLQLQGKSTPHFESFVQLCFFWAGEEVRFKGGVRYDFEICTSFLVPCKQLIPHLSPESPIPLSVFILKFLGRCHKMSYPNNAAVTVHLLVDKYKKKCKVSKSPRLYGLILTHIQVIFWKNVTQIPPLP